MPSANSSGEITLVYEADTERFHRYRGHKSGKEVTVYLERNKYIFHSHEIKAIITIEDRPKTVAEVNEERQKEKLAKYAENYGMSNAVWREQMAAAGRAAAMKEINEIRKQQIALLEGILTVTRDNNRLLAEINNAQRTKVNNRRSAKKRS